MSLPGSIDHAHPAATDLLENFVISKEPRLLRCLHLGENALVRCLRNLVTAFQSLAQETADANSGVDSDSCCTLLAFSVLCGDARLGSESGSESVIAQLPGSSCERCTKIADLVVDVGSVFDGL